MHDKDAIVGVGLRTRTGIAFAALALLLSVSLAVMTYELTRSYLIAKRESLATREALTNAHSVATLLQNPAVDRATLLPNLSSVGGSSSVLQLDGQWFASTIDVGRHAIPSDLRSLRGNRTRAPTGHDRRRSDDCRGRSDRAEPRRLLPGVLPHRATEHVADARVILADRRRASPRSSAPLSGWSRVEESCVRST